MRLKLPNLRTNLLILGRLFQLSDTIITLNHSINSVMSLGNCVNWNFFQVEAVLPSIYCIRKSLLK